MRKVVFGSACMVAGMLLVLIMLFIGAFPNAYDNLNLFGHIVVWIGVISAIIGVVLCIGNLCVSRNDTEDNAEDDTNDITEN